MLKIENGIISLNRGDDVSFTVEMSDGEGGAYQMEAGDELLFAVKKTSASAEPVLLSVRSQDKRIYLNHADTCDMDVGRYSAAIKLLRACGDVLVVYPTLESHGRERAWNNFVLDPEVAS